MFLGPKESRVGNIFWNRFFQNELYRKVCESRASSSVTLLLCELGRAMYDEISFVLMAPPTRGNGSEILHQRYNIANYRVYHIHYLAGFWWIFLSMNSDHRFETSTGPSINSRCSVLQKISWSSRIKIHWCQKGGWKSSPVAPKLLGSQPIATSIRNSTWRRWH